MKRSGTRWAMGVVAPWCLAVGLLVSFTADAGQTATVGGSLAALSAEAVQQPDDLVPLGSAALTGDFGHFGLGRPAATLEPARYETGRNAEFRAITDEIEPRRELKRQSATATPAALPVIDRSHKGAPVVGLRPTFDTRLRRPGGMVSARQSEMLAPHDDAMPAAGFSLADTGADPLDGSAAFAPWAAGEDMQDASDEARDASAAIAMRPAALKERLAQGATPKVARADALSSTTPTPADGAPIAMNLRLPDATIVPRIAGRPNYAALLVGDHGARERKCLAEAVYFESRSEPEEGQAAVAQVVLNRATSGLYPASICGVVYQNRTHYKACQFSFACEGKSLRVTEMDSWHTATRIADAVIGGQTYLSDVGGATHYHANYVRPGWARRLVKMDVIGHHVFYKLHAGQS